MPAVGTNLIYELIVESIIGDTTSSNILGYFNDDATPADPASGELLTEFGTIVLTPWVALINDRVTIIKTSARRLNNLTDFATISQSTPGTRAADSSTNFVAFKIDKNRLTKETRSGWINIMGVSEDDTNATGQSLAAASLTRLDTLAAALQATLSPTVNTFIPVIIGNKYNYATTPPTLNPESAWVFNEVAQMSSDPFVTSQVSRKR